MMQRYTRTDTALEIILHGMMDNSGLIILIQALIDAKIAKISVMDTHSHSDFVRNI